MSILQIQLLNDKKAIRQDSGISTGYSDLCRNRRCS